MQVMVLLYYSDEIATKKTTDTPTVDMLGLILLNSVALKCTHHNRVAVLFLNAMVEHTMLIQRSHEEISAKITFW